MTPGLDRKGGAETTGGNTQNPIVVVGAPRSGTTWLAKIIDSHPDVLYRHEPDHDDRSLSATDDAAVAAAVRRWAANRSQRSAGKRPYFRKSYRSWGRHVLRWGTTCAILLAERALPATARTAWAIPDLIDPRHPRPRIEFKSIGLSAGAGTIARSLPDSRVILILRHPCGQVASVMRGSQLGRFDLRTAGTDMPFHEADAMALAARNGIARQAFQHLPDAAKYAWGWRAWNETAYLGLCDRQNMMVLIYETLCANPELEAQRVFSFCGLSWTAQTERFVRRSASHDQQAGYYGVFRESATAAGAWRSSTEARDQEAVRAVLSGSPLARFWPDAVK